MEVQNNDSMVKRVERHIIKPGHQFYPKIDALCLASKNLYNCVMYSARHSFFYGYGIPSLAQLHTFFKDSEQYKALPAKVSQLVIKQVCDAWDSYFKALEVWKQEPEKFTGKPKIPGYAENRNLVKYNNQAYSKKELKKGKLVNPSMSNIWVPAHPPITVDNLCEVRLVPKVGCYVIEIVYEVESAEIIHGTLIHADVNGAYNIGRKVIPTAFAHLQQIVARDSGCLVVHPRRITPVARTKLRSVLTLLKTAQARSVYIWLCKTELCKNALNSILQQQVGRISG